MKTSTTTIEKFITGNVYQMRFVGDSDLAPLYVCFKTTEKTASFKSVKDSETFTRKINIFNNQEFVLLGSYSFAPRIKAANN